MDNKEIYTKVEELNEKITYFEEGKLSGFLVPESANNEILKDKYKNFEISPDLISDGSGVLYNKIYVNNSTAKETLIKSISNDEGIDFWELVFSIEDAFSKKNFDIRKFRGDLAEAIFLQVIGGEKYYEQESVDIKYDDELIEIKSYSLTKKEITISNQQVNNKVLTYAVGLTFDNEEGKTIIEIADSLSGNEDFKNYINETYGNTFIGNRSKYSINRRSIKDITEFIKNLSLNEFVVEARVRII